MMFDTYYIPINSTNIALDIFKPDYIVCNNKTHDIIKSNINDNAIVNIREYMSDRYVCIFWKEDIEELKNSDYSYAPYIPIKLTKDKNEDNIVYIEK